MKSSFFFIPFFSFLLFTGLFAASNPSPESLLQDVLTYTNNFRKANGLRPLVMRNDLNAIAQKHSEDMARGRVGFGHSGFNRREAQARKIIDNAGSFAENVAYGASSGKEVVEGWKRSPGHRQNLLGPYKYIGIGIASDRRGRLYYTQLFVD